MMPWYPVAILTSLPDRFRDPDSSSPPPLAEARVRSFPLGLNQDDAIRSNNPWEGGGSEV